MCIRDRSSPLRYTQVCDGSSSVPVGVADAQYVTCKLTTRVSTRGTGLDLVPGYGAAFVLAVKSAGAKIDGFQVIGNLGADGGGEMQHGKLGGPDGTTAYFKQVFDAGHDPSINHIVLFKGGGGADEAVASNTDDGLHELRLHQGVQTLYYVMWAGKEGYKYQKDALEAVVDAVAVSCLSAEAPPAGGGGAFGIVLFILFAVGLIALAIYDQRRGWPLATSSAERLSDLSKGVKQRVSSSSAGRTSTGTSYVQHRSDACSYTAPLHVSPQATTVPATLEPPLSSPLSGPLSGPTAGAMAVGAPPVTSPLAASIVPPSSPSAVVGAASGPD
eukprot:2160208-Prymnesium_polylepis.1